MEPQAVPQPQTPPIPPTPPTPQIKNLLVLIMSILLIITVGIAGLFYFQIQKLSKELSKYQTQPSPTPTATFNPTANLKIYTNTKYGYQVSYSSDWIINIDPTINIETAENVNFRKISDETPATSGFSIIVNEDPEGIFASQICKTVTTANPEPRGFLCSKNITSSKFIIGQVEWEKLSENNISLPPTGYVLYNLAENKKLYIVYIWNAEETTVNQILSTFKFIDKECKEGTVLKQCKLGPCCCPVGATCD